MTKEPGAELVMHNQQWKIRKLMMKYTSDRPEIRINK